MSKEENKYTCSKCNSTLLRIAEDCLICVNCNTKYALAIASLKEVTVPASAPILAKEPIERERIKQIEKNIYKDLEISLMNNNCL